MNKYFQRMLKEEQKTIEDYKWCESERAGKDLGVEAIRSWISKFARKFRKDFIKKASVEIMKQAEKEIGELEDLTEITIEDIERYRKLIKLDEKE